MEPLTDALFELAAAIVTLVALVVGVYLVPLIKAHTTARRRQQAWNLVQSVYSYAHDNYDLNAVKSEALKRGRARLEEYGLKYSDADIAELVEAADDAYEQGRS